MAGSKKQGTKLPLFLKSLFWSYDFSKIDRQKHKKRIIINTINYGQWHHWQWLVKEYGAQSIKKIVEEVPITEFRSRALKLISLLLSIKRFNYAPRGIKSRNKKSFYQA